MPAMQSVPVPRLLGPQLLGMQEVLWEEEQPEDIELSLAPLNGVGWEVPELRRAVRGEQRHCSVSSLIDLFLNRGLPEGKEGLLSSGGW